MNEQEIHRLAHAINELRADWPIASLTTFISKHLVRRPYRDAAVALAWVATDRKPDGTPASDTPKRVLEAGPWWRAVNVEAAVGGTGNPRPGEECRTCGRHLEHCICGGRVTKPEPPAPVEVRNAALAQARAALRGGAR